MDVTISRKDILTPLEEFERIHNILGTRDDFSERYREVDMDVEKTRKKVYDQFKKFNF